MTIRRRVEAEADDTKTGMTLPELAAFVEAALDAQNRDGAGVRVKATITMKGRIKRLELLP